MFDFGNFHTITEKYFVLNEYELQVISKFSTTEHIKCLVQIAMNFNNYVPNFNKDKSNSTY